MQNIIPFSSPDFSNICTLWENSVLATHHFLAQEDFDYYKEMVPDYFSQATLYVYQDGDVIKGFLGVSEDNIDMLFVDPAYLGQGVGKALLLYALNELGAQKVDVNEQNAHAYQFYQHFGFVVVCRSEIDDMQKPYPILHLELKNRYGAIQGAAIEIKKEESI